VTLVVGYRRRYVRWKNQAAKPATSSRDTPAGEPAAPVVVAGCRRRHRRDGDGGTVRASARDRAPPVAQHHDDRAVRYDYESLTVVVAERAIS
jgi:hypothetical protein